MQCLAFNLPFQIAIYTRELPSTHESNNCNNVFLQFNFVVILRLYSKKQDPRGYPGNIAAKDCAILISHSQIWHKACS